MSNKDLKEDNPYLNIGRKLNLLLRTGQMLMESGADTARIVRDTKLVATNMGIPIENFTLHVSYTTLMLNVSEGNNSYTNFKKCLNHGVDMTVISAISKLAWRSVEQHYSLDDYEAELNRIKIIPRQYSPLLSSIAAGFASGGFCKLFGCDWIAFFYTAICAFCGFWIRILCNKWGVNNYASIAIAAFFATFLAYLTHFIPGSTTPWYPLIACTLFIYKTLVCFARKACETKNHLLCGWAINVIQKPHLSI